MDDVYALVRRAILERKPVHAFYAGHERWLCPHVLGTSDGEARALFFQFAGSSARGLEPGGDWRCLPLAGLSRVTLHEGRWRTKVHSQPQHCVYEVDVEVPARGGV
jgi:hypothetical protein